MSRGPTLEEFFAREFAALEKEWDASQHLPALYDVIERAHIGSVAPPAWAVRAVLNLIVASYNATSGKKRIRSKYALDYTHRQRWQALDLAFKLRGIEYAKKSGRPKDAPGIEEARQEASDMLKKNFAWGTPRQVQDSFDKVEKARGTDAESRYFFSR
jgi:hypothetical protein